MAKGYIFKFGDGDDDDDELFMEIPTDKPPFNEGDDDLCNSLGADSSLNVEDLLNNEIWDEAGVCDIKDDFPQNESLPNVNEHVSSTCRNLNVLLARCLVILLAYFWTYFHVSNNDMEFLLAGLKRFFEIAGASSHWIA